MGQKNKDLNNNTQLKEEFEKFDETDQKNPPRYDLQKNTLFKLDKTDESFSEKLDRKMERESSLLFNLSFISSRLFR